jgi:ABC-type sugar transport system permease subunit
MAAKASHGFRRRLVANSGFLFVTPAVATFVVFGLYTVVYSFALSFFRWNGFSRFSLLPFQCQPPGCRFVGLDNFTDFLDYNRFVTARLFWDALVHNLVIAVALPVGTILVALPLALSLNRAARGQALYRTFVMLPMVTAGIAVYYVWLGLYQPDGPLNGALGSLGLGVLEAQNGWLGDINRALPSLIVVMVWSNIPFATILYLAGLQSLDSELYEAARIDGARGWSMLRHITWPLLNRVTLLVVITSVNVAMQGYEINYLMTGGGPANHTDVVGLQIFQFGFGGRVQLGMASAMAWTLFVMVLAIGLVNLRLFRSHTET